MQLNQVLRAVDEWPVARVAVGVTDATHTLAAHGQLSERFPIASVTKVLVAMGVWIGVEEGVLSFDHPVGPVGATVGHLLAHTSGLPLEGMAPIAKPGARRIYSNIGYRLLADKLASSSAMSAGAYLGEAVFSPLGMVKTELVGTADGGAESTLEDLLAIARELLAPTLVDVTTHSLVTSPAWPDVNGVLPGFGRQSPNPWGLGPEIRGEKTPHWTAQSNSASTFGHFGRSGTFLWVDPEAGLGMVCLTDRPFDDWAKTAWPALSGTVLAAD